MSISYIIEGRNRLHGEVTVGGSQQKAAFSIISSLLTEDTVVIHNVPKTVWIEGLIECVQFLGVMVERKENTLTIHASSITTTALPVTLVEKTPYSILLIGALLSRTKRVSLGITEYSYAFDSLLFHQSIFQQAFQNEVKSENGYYVIHGEMKGTDIVLEYPSPLASMQALLVAVSAKKSVVIKNLSSNPDIEFSKKILKGLGVKIEEKKQGELLISIDQPLSGAEIQVTGDINEAVFWAVATLITKGDTSIHGVTSQDITPFLSKLTALGVQFKLEENTLSLWCENLKELKPVHIEIKPFPGVIPEWAGWMLVMLHQVTEPTTLAPTARLDNMNYIQLLRQLGMEINVETYEETKDGLTYPSKITVFGGGSLTGSNVTTSDIWDSLVILLAALEAKGTTTITSHEILDHAFENLTEKLAALHANVGVVS